MNIITQDGPQKRFLISLLQESHFRRAKAARTNKFHLPNNIHTKKRITRQRIYITRGKMILIGIVSVLVPVESPVRVLGMFRVHPSVVMRRKCLTLQARR